MGIEEIAQVAQPSLGSHHAVQGLEHRAVAGLVERQLHAYVLRTLHIDELPIVRHTHHHAVVIDVTDGACKREKVDSGPPGISR